MPPLIGDLLGRGRDRLDNTQWANLTSVEGIAARGCLRMNSCKIRIDSATGFCVCLKALQLRMVPIASCLSAQYRLCQKRFAPQRHQALRIEVLRMDAPESHVT